MPESEARIITVSHCTDLGLEGKGPVPSEHSDNRIQMIVSLHIFDDLIDDRLYSAILRSLEQTHYARM